MPCLAQAVSQSRKARFARIRQPLKPGQGDQGQLLAAISRRTECLRRDQQGRGFEAPVEKGMGEDLHGNASDLRSRPQKAAWRVDRIVNEFHRWPRASVINRPPKYLEGRDSDTT